MKYKSNMPALKLEDNSSYFLQLSFYTEDTTSHWVIFSNEPSGR